jgi:hypothetical protein
MGKWHADKKSHNGLHTRNGDPVRNAKAYSEAGGECFNTQGKPIARPVQYEAKVLSLKSQNSDSPKDLYHYTTAENAEKIRESGKIVGSKEPGDCALGEGVYLTSRAPNCSNHTLNHNNWDGAGDHIPPNRTEAYVKIPAHAVNAYNGRRDLGRDVWVKPGDLDLKECGATIGRR